MKHVIVRIVALVALVLVAGCEKPGRPARVTYNVGVKALADGELDLASQSFLEALNSDDYDDDLRFRTNFNLAAVEAKRAEAAAGGQPKDVTGAVEHYRKAMTWLGDALRIREKDEDARANLERIQARILSLIDEANQGANSLEQRLDQAIDAERALRDAARQLWAAQDARGAGADPLADKEVFETAAARQRILGTETGVIADLAGDEITAIGGKAEDQRTDEEKVRLVQLQNLDLYIQDARKAMVDARRNLHDLHGELAHGRTEAALESLKRGREQLLDPVSVLQGVAGDQLQTAQLTDALDQLSKGKIIGKDGGAPQVAPAWLTTATLGEDQAAIRARLEEVKARFAAGLGPDAPADPATDAQGAPDPKAAERARLRELVAAAMPPLEEATTAMTRASDALGAGDAAKAFTAQRDALIAMSRAIELFLELRKLVDVTLAEQRAVVTALTPPAAGAEAMSAAERAKIVGEGTKRNQDRLLRMQGLIVAEKEKLAAQAAAAAAQAQQQGGAAEADPQAQQAAALYEQLEALRAQAATAADEVAAVAAGGKGAALASAQTAEAKLAEMQKLMFSVLEHLQELIREQGETRDQTAKAELEDDAGRAPLLPGLIQRQGEHASMADAIAQALAAQADAAAQGGAQPQPGQPTPQAFAEAAGEVRNARTAMQDSSDTLAKARDNAGAMSYNLQPVLEDQQTAKDHLENALRLLSPPKQQDGDQKQDQDQQKQDQQDQQQQAQPSDQSPEDAERRLQRVREREAQRQREQQERQRPSTEPVERDW